MSTMVYNGISLEGAALLSYAHDAIQEYGVYLYTRHIIHVRAVYNPLLISYGLAQTGTVVHPLEAAGQAAAITEQAIRHHLMQPRGILQFSTGTAASITPAAILGGPLSGNTMLTSPRPGYTVDSNNGPIPLRCTVEKIVGTKSFIVDFAIQTDVNEAYLFSTSPPAILLHQWRMESSIGPDYYSVRTIQGRAVFDTGVLAAANGGAGVLPDQFRAWLFHPIPLSFKRDTIDVVAAQDGASLEYTVVDREQPFCVFARGSDQNPTRIESGATGRPLPVNYAANVYCGPSTS